MLILKLVFTPFLLVDSQTIKLPNRPSVQPRSLGCNNFATFYETFTIDAAGGGAGGDLASWKLDFPSIQALLVHSCV